MVGKLKVVASETVQVESGKEQERIFGDDGNFCLVLSGDYTCIQLPKFTERDT